MRGSRSLRLKGHYFAGGGVADSSKTYLGMFNPDSRL